MQRVDHYLRQAKAARELAASATSEPVRIQFENIAATWEQLAQRARLTVAAQNRRAEAARFATAI